MNKTQLLAWLLVFACTTSQATVRKTLFKDSGMDAVRFDVQVDGLKSVPSPIRARFKVNSLSLQGVEPYSGVLYQVGSPRIPVIRFLLQGTVSVKADGPETEYQLESGTMLEPNLAPVVKLPGHRPKIAFDPIAYQSEAFYPQAPYSITRAGSRDGMPLLLVTLYPVSYQAKTGKIHFRQSFTVIAKRAPSRNRGDSLYAFVIGKKFAASPSLKSYVEFKQKQGFRVVAGVVGVDFSTPEQIRSWLQHLLPSGLKYALLVGDAEDLPSHPSKHINGVTDHYYRAIDTADYEQDINGPDIGVGRVAVQTEEQLQAVVAKFIRYQTMAPGSAKWAHQVSFVATDDRWEIAEATHNYVIGTYTSKLGYQGSFPNPATASGGDRLYAITHHAGTANLAAAFNEGRAIIDYSGHGYDGGWAGPAFSAANVRALSNPDALPFVIGNACETGQFTASESFGETWLRHPAAAIAYWGSMDSTYWDEDDILERRMFDGIFRGGTRTLGDITSYALSALWNHYGGQEKSAYYWETYVLFGDPSIALQVNARKR